MTQAPPAQNRPAKHGDCAIFACDAGHLPFAWVSALRIAAAEPDRRFDIAIAAPGFEALPASCLDGPVRLISLDPASLPRIVQPNPRITAGSIYRYLLPDLLGGDYRALLYMDTDTYLDRPGIQGLFDRMPAVPVAAAPNFVAREYAQARGGGRGRRTDDLISDLGGRDGRYYQSGVLAIDTARYAAEGITARVTAFADAHKDLLQKHRLSDQAALNGSCADIIAPLSPLWNWHNHRWLHPVPVARFRPHILHFTGMKKPWVVTDDPLVSRYNAPYFEALRTLDPDFRPEMRRNSLAELAANPRIGIPALDAAHRGLRRRILALRGRRHIGSREAIDWMQARIDEAEVA